MSVRKLSTASILSPAYKNSKIWDGTTFPGYFESIATAIVDSSGASSITFSNIPQNYTHLQLRVFTFLSVGNTTTIIRVNGDAGSNYSYHRILGSYNGVTSSAQATRDSYAAGFAGAPTYACVGIIDFLDYNNTNKYKVMRSLIGSDANTNYSSTTQTGNMGLWSGSWRNTNAITSMVISPENGENFAQYSHFALYGIRGI